MRSSKPRINQMNKGKNNRLSCIIITFLLIVLVLVLLLVYFAATFPESDIKNNDHSELLQHISTDSTTLQTIKPQTQLPQQNRVNPFQSLNQSKDFKTLSIYNTTNSIQLRLMHESSVQLGATPFLVGLGAEKSGSTSLGAAMFNSGEFTCPEPNEIDVETKYWSNCFQWNVQNNLKELIQKLENKNGGHCSIKQYQSWQRWKNGKYKFEKSVDYFGLPYVTRIFSDLFVKQRGTKIFVMIRYPPPRISSTWKFFVGAEKDKMPNEYGYVERFTEHLLTDD